MILNEENSNKRTFSLGNFHPSSLHYQEICLCEAMSHKKGEDQSLNDHKPVHQQILLSL